LDVERALVDQFHLTNRKQPKMAATATMSPNAATIFVRIDSRASM
jgi:hypothetical protein